MEPKELLTKRRIEKLAKQYEDYGEFSNVKSNRTNYDVFISHSSSDNEFIRKVLLFLKYSKDGVHGYVDWQDPNLNHETDEHTALILKKRIQNAKKVIYVVTPDSLKSVWCSWEIGYADRDKSPDNIAILAIKPNNGKWKQNEYLQSYPWISYDEKRRLFLVHKPNGNVLSLYDWINNLNHTIF